MAPLPDRLWWGELNVVAGKQASVSSSGPWSVGIPNPGEATSCPLTTSPKNGCRPLDAGLLAGEPTFFRVGVTCWSRLLLLPVVRRVVAFELRGVDGAG